MATNAIKIRVVVIRPARLICKHSLIMQSENIKQYNRNLEAVFTRGAVLQWLARSLITRPARFRKPGQTASIIRFKNLALYIRD